MWLRNILNSARGHECQHEAVDFRSKTIPQPWTPFPVGRWHGKEHYGEVNGMLRYHLSGQCLGREMEIPGRYYLRRNPLDIIASWMAQEPRSDEELSATCHEVLWHQANLTAWAALANASVVDIEGLWSSREALQALVDDLGLDIRITGEHMEKRNHSHRRYTWNPRSLRIAQKAADRMGAAHCLAC